MSFIRVKEIGKKKKYRYAYLVENTWKKRKGAARQKVGKYLGKVLKIEKQIEILFSDWIKADIEEYAKNSLKLKIVTDLIRYQLIIRGFIEEGNLMKKEGVEFDIISNVFMKNGKENKLVLEMNEGFLCSYTINALLSFKPKGDDEHADGINLAKLFLETGLNVPKEVFVEYFHKV